MLKKLKNLLREGNPHFVSKLLSFLVITISLLVLVGGWALDIAFLRSLIPNTATMKINTALLFLMMGLAVWLQTDKKMRRLSTLLASFALLLSGLTLLEYAFGWDLGIDQLFGIDPYTLANAFPGRPSIVAALIFSLIAGAYLLPYSYLSWVILLLLNLILYPALLGYASYNLSFYDILGYESISLPTTVAFLFLIGSIIVTHPIPGMNKNSSGLLANRIFRTLTPIIIPIGLLWGWAAHLLHDQGWVDADLEIILLNVLMVTNAMIIVYWITFVLNKTHLELQALEDNYTKLLGNTGSLVAVLDKDGRFKHINDVGQQYWSYRQLIGRSLFDIFPRKYAQNYYELINEVVEQEKIISGDVEASIDGSIFWFYANLSPVKNKDGEVDSVVLSAWDITERKQAESSLKTSEAHFRAMFEENTSVMILADPKTGRFLDANAAACQFYGYDHDTFTDKYIEQISDMDIRDIQSQLQPDAIKENQFYIAKHRLANGEVRTVENRISPIEIDGEILLLGVVVDISQRIKAENRLAEQERDLALILDGSQAGTWSWWVGTERSQINERWAEIVGYELEELTQGDVNTWVDLAHPEDLKGWDEQVQRHIRGELDTLEEEIRMRHKDGHWVWVQVHGKIVERDKDGTPLRLSGIHIDISDRKAAEEKLIASEKKLKSLMETETHFVIRTDMEGRYTYWNAPFEEEFGWLFEPEGIRGAYSLQAIKTYHHEKVHKTVEKCILNPGKVFQVEIDKPAKDESTRTTLWEFVCLTDENDQPTEIQCMGMEITARVEAEKALNEEYKLRDALFSSLRDAVFILDADSPTILDCNPAAAQIFGYQRDEMLGRPTDFLHVDEAALAAFREELYPALNEKGYLHLLDFSMRKKDGTIFPTENHVIPLLNEVGEQTGWLSVVADLTLRKQAEERFRTMFEESGITMLLINPENGALIDANPAACDFYGYKKPEMLQKKISEINTLSKEEVQQEMENALHEKRNAFIFKHRLVNGEIRDVEVRSTPITVQGEAVLFSIIVDVTSKLQAEKLAEENRERMALAVEGANAGTWDWWVQSGDTIFNERWAEIVGYTLDELAPVNIQTWLDLCHPDDLQRSDIKLDEHFSGQSPHYQCEARMKHKNGHWVWVLDHGKVVEWDAEGKPLRMSGTHIDITEKKLAEEKLKQSETDLSFALQSAHAGTWTWDIASNAASFNERWAEMLGYTLSELAPLSNQTWNSLCHPGDVAKVNILIAELTKGEKETFVAEVRMKHKAGHWVWVQDHGKVVEWDAAGKPLRMSGIHIDISETKVNEMLLNTRLELLQYADTHTLQEVMQYALDLAGELTDSPIGFFHFVDNDQSGLTLKAWSTNTINTYCEIEGHDHHYPINQAGIWADCVRQRKAIIHNHYAEEANRKGLPEGHAPLIRELVLPIMRKEQVVAVIGIGNKETEYIAKDQEILQAFSDFTWDIIERKNAQDALNKRETMLRETQRIGKIGSWEWIPPNRVMNVSDEFLKILETDGKDNFVAFDELAQKLDPTVLKQVQDKERATYAARQDLDQEFPIILADGTKRWIHQIGKITYTENGEITRKIGSIQDITARKEAEDILRMQLTRMKTLNIIDQLLRKTEELQDILPQLAEIIGKETGLDAIAILPYDHANKKLILGSIWGFREEPLEKGRLSLGEGLAGRAAQSLKVIHLDVKNPNISIEKNLAEFLKREEIIEYIAVPMLAQGKLGGVVELFQRSRLKTPQETTNYITTAAGQIAMAQNNQNLIRDLQYSNKELMEAYDATIYGWSRAMDLRDEETEGHTQRVTQLAEKMAKKMGIPAEELVHIRRGALIHDIGKLGVPDSILLKPGKLTDDEWKTMKEHPSYAYEMLSEVEYLCPALDIPYCHHEKWDGTGYPRGLKGKEIPKAARIFAVIDIWDALRSDRPYRKAWSREKTLEHIQELSGTHLDPVVVAVFLELINEKE